jgi:hypothetical protein
MSRKVKIKILVTLKDPQGMARAWGMGDTREIASRVAHEQLDAYRAEKRSVGDPLAEAEFSEHVSEIEGPFPSRFARLAQRMK